GPLAPVRRAPAAAPPRPRAAPGGPKATPRVFRSCDRSLLLLAFVTKGWRGSKLHRVPPSAHAAAGAAWRSSAFSRSSALAAPLRQLSAIDSDVGSGKIS